MATRKKVGTQKPTEKTSGDFIGSLIASVLEETTKGNLPKIASDASTVLKDLQEYAFKTKVDKITSILMTSEPSDVLLIMEDVQKNLNRAYEDEVSKRNRELKAVERRRII